MRDPRSHRSYQQAARSYINRQPNPASCSLCGETIDTRLPRTIPEGPTIEHRAPIRYLRTIAVDDADLLTLALDETNWALAHRRCQDKQGAAAANTRNTRRHNSREW